MICKLSRHQGLAMASQKIDTSKDATDTQLVGQISQKKMLFVSVIPNSSRSKVVAYDPQSNVLKVALKAPPSKGKANAELVRFLFRFLRKEIEIISGKTSKKKCIKIH